MQNFKQEQVFIVLFLFISCYTQLSNFLINHVVNGKIKVKLALAIPTGAPIAVVKEIIDTPQLVAQLTFYAYNQI